MNARLSGHFSIFGLDFFVLFWDINVRRWNLQFCNFDPKAFSGFQGCALRKFEGAQLTEPVKSRVPNL